MLLFLFLLFAEERPLPSAASPGPAQQLGSMPKQSLSTEPEQTAGSPSSSPSMRGLSSYFSKTFSTVFSQSSSSSRPPSTLVDELWLSEEGMLRMVVVVFLLLLRPFLLSSADDGNGQQISGAALPQGLLQHTQRILSALLALVHRPHSLAAATSGLSFADFVPCFKRAPTSSSPSGMQQQRSSLAQDIVACDLSVADVQAALRELSTDVMVSEAKVGRGCPLHIL